MKQNKWDKSYVLIKKSRSLSPNKIIEDSNKINKEKTNDLKCETNNTKKK